MASIQAGCERVDRLRVRENINILTKAEKDIVGNAEELELPYKAACIFISPK